MAFFKHNASAPRPPEAAAEAPPAVPPASLPEPPPLSPDGLRDFWLHSDYVLGAVRELSEFGVKVLEGIGLILEESLIAPQDLGTAVRAGDVVVEKGSRIHPRMVPMLSGMGFSYVLVRPNPRVLVIALTPEAISASYLVAAIAKEAGADSYRIDNDYRTADQTVAGIFEQLVRADLVVTVGGLGEAGLDIRKAAGALGPNDFTPVAITPGSEHGFALLEGGIPLLALPADTYPVFILGKLLLEPVIAKLMATSTDLGLASAYLAQPLRVKPRILTAVPATVEATRLKISGLPTGLAGLHTIYQANALAILTSDDDLVGEESEVVYLPLT